MRAFDAATDAAAAAAAAAAAGGGGSEDERVWPEAPKGAVKTDGAAGIYGGVGVAQNGVAGSKNGAADEDADPEKGAVEWGAVNDDGGREERRFPIENVVEVNAVDGAVVRGKDVELDAATGAGKERRGAGRNEDVFGSRWVVILVGGTALSLGG